MSSKVYFAPARAKRWDYSASQAAGLKRLIEEMDFGGIAKGEYVAIKTHFGSEGAHRVVRPVSFYLGRRGQSGRWQALCL